VDDDPLEETLFGDEKSEAEQELTPSVDIPDSSDADPRLQRQFWLLVLVFNAALLAFSVGLLLVVFHGRWDDGTTAVVVGIVLFVYGYYRYRTVTQDD
jgi:predicted cobalt transporter CbtA